MVAPITGSKLSSIRSLPTVSSQAEPPQPRAEATLPGSDFRGAKPKLVDMSGSGPVGSRPMSTRADLALEVAQQRAGGATAVPNAAFKKSLARLSLPSATGVDLAAALTSLSPSKQLELLKALPYGVRTRLEAQRAALPTEQRGPMLSYLGDKGLAGLAKDGQISITAGNPFTTGRDQRTPTSYPAKIDLGNGKHIDVTNLGGVLTLKMGGKKLRAEMSFGQWQFFEKVTPQMGDSMAVHQNPWKPLKTATADQWLMISAFREGAMVARGVAGNLDPATSVLFRDQEITAKIPAARKAIESLTVETSKLTGWVNSSAASFLERQKLLAPAVKAGYVKVDTGADGRVSLSLNRPSGMRESEWQKIQTEFGPRLAVQSQRLGSDQQWLSTQLSMRDDAAYGVLNTFSSPPFQKYLAGLPPTERIAELTRLSESLKGSSAGRSFAADLFGAAALSPSMQPTTPLAKTALDGAWSTPASREAMKGLALSVAAQLPQQGAAGLQRTMEINLGRPLTPSENKAAVALASVKTPADLSKLIKPDQKSAPGPLDSAGDVADLLGNLGSAAGEDKLNVVGRDGAHFEKISAAFKIGAGFVAAAQVLRSGAGLFNDGVSVDTGLSFAQDASRAIGTWGALLQTVNKLPAVTRVLKHAGPISDALGLVNDLRRDASSSEGRYDNNVHVGASALILAGGLAGGPVGVAGVLVGLGVKLFYNRTSESYEEMHARLRRTIF